MMMMMVGNSGTSRKNASIETRKTQNTYSLPDSALLSSTGSNRLMNSSLWLCTGGQCDYFLLRIRSFAVPFTFSYLRTQIYGSLLMVRKRKKTQDAENIVKKLTRNTQATLKCWWHRRAQLPDGKRTYEKSHKQLHNMKKKKRLHNSTQLRMSRLLQLWRWKVTAILSSRRSVWMTQIMADNVVTFVFHSADPQFISEN